MAFTITIEMMLVASLVLNYFLIGAIICAVEEDGGHWTAWVLLMLLWPIVVVLCLIESVRRAFEEF